MSIKIKKLTLQYSYLELEKSEVKEQFEISNSDMQDYIKENYPEYYKDIYFPASEQVTGESSECNEKEEEKEEETKPPKNKDLKKLYHKIALKTHPDKTKNLQYADMFQEAVSAYEDNNLAALVKIAGMVNIELVSMTPESIALIKENINTITNEIEKIKGTIAWSWHQAQTKKDKKKIIKYLCNLKGVKYDEDKI